MKIPGGYYIKARKIKDSWVSQASPCVRETWDYLLREANHKDQRYGGFEVKRGQLFRSFKEIRDDLKWAVGYRFERYSENDMKHCMKLLRREGMIQLTSHPRGNLISIVQYSRYQDPSLYESTNESTNESTSNQPMINQQALPINKNVKKEKKKEDNYTITKERVRTPKKVFEEDSEEMRLARGLYGCMKSNNPNVKEPSYQLWALEFNKILRIDGRTFEECKEMIKWVQLNDFWHKYILSPAKLREKWDQLYLVMREKKKNPVVAVFNSNFNFDD